MKDLKNTLRKNPILTFVVSLVIGLLIYNFITRPFSGHLNRLADSIISEVLAGSFIAFVVYLVSGPEEIGFSLRGFGYALKLAWSFLLIFWFFGFFTFFQKATQSGFSTEFGPPLLTILGVAVLVLFVGIFEEGIFRGLALNAFLAKNGDSFKGVLMACIVSAFLFGLAHVYPDIIGLFIDPSTLTLIVIIQMIEKTLQTMLFGFLYAVIVLKTHNLWDVILLHALSDFATLLPGYLFVSEQSSYVASGETGVIQIWAYVIILVLMIPGTIYSYFQLKKVELPQWGFFREEWKPLKVKAFGKNRDGLD